MRGDRETTFCLDQLNYLTKHNQTTNFELRIRNSLLILSLSLPLSFNLFEQLIDSLALFLNAIAHEVNFGRAGQIQRKTELLPNVRRRVLQSRQRLLMFFLITPNRDVNTRGFFIRRKANVCYG